MKSDIFENIAAAVLEPIREKLSDHEYDVVRSDIVFVLSELDRKDVSTATKEDFVRFAFTALSGLNHCAPALTGATLAIKATYPGNRAGQSCAIWADWTPDTVSRSHVADFGGLFPPDRTRNNAHHGRCGGHGGLAPCRTTDASAAFAHPTGPQMPSAGLDPAFHQDKNTTPHAGSAATGA